MNGSRWSRSKGLLSRTKARVRKIKDSNDSLPKRMAALVEEAGKNG